MRHFLLAALLAALASSGAQAGSPRGKGIKASARPAKAAKRPRPVAGSTASWAGNRGRMNSLSTVSPAQGQSSQAVEGGGPIAYDERAGQNPTNHKGVIQEK